jgi:trehalose 6-phosphate synthase/phosphatase
MAKKKFIVVSNRLPVNVTKTDGRLVFSPSSGGLATALSKLFKDMEDSLWIGWPGICKEDTTPSEREAIAKKLASRGCFPVFLTRRQVRKYYDGYANDTIWPLFHYFQSYVVNDLSYWDGYVKVNDIFAKTVLKHADKDSKIWVHDYHLMLLPQKLRAKLPESSIGFFLHVPFPSYEIFRLLPNRADVLAGMLGADLIGFHVYDYARHFLSSVLRVKGLESENATITVGSRSVRADAFPIGIDYRKFASAEKDKKIAKELESLTDYYKAKKIILSMDRLDYSKGILVRLSAFEQFIRKHPQYRGKVILAMVVVPSRVEVDTYKDLKKEIEQTVSRINGRYSTVSWSPISYQFRNLPFKQVASLLIRADIALLTPLRDGMNLVAKEYVATKQTKPGVLILSEMTGAIDEMPEAISVNPNDVNQIEGSILAALKMPKKAQMQKIRSMQKRLSQYNVKRWAEDFMQQLDKSKKAQHAQSNKLVDKSVSGKISRAFKKSKRRLIVLDYDGTLVKLVSSHDPKKSRPPAELIALLRKIAKKPGTLLCIVSGRPREVMETWFGKLPIALSAEHGAWIKAEGEWSRHQISLSIYRKAVMPILRQYADRTPGAEIEEKDFSIVWHYRNVPPELAQARNSSLEYELTNLLGSSDFSVFKGSKILEIKPMRINKGMVVEDFLAMHKPDFVLSAGDDNTDEDMFRAIADDAFSIKVGLGETAARFQVLGVNDVLKLLESLADAKK